MRNDVHNYSSYTNNGCRCSVCKEANRTAIAAMRTQRRAQVVEHGLPSSTKHGSSAYVNWGCRCSVCTKSHTDRRTKQP